MLKKTQYWSLIFITALITSCKNKNEKQSAAFVYKGITSDSIKTESYFYKVLKDTINGILQVTIKDDTLNIVSDGKLSYQPFDLNTNPKLLEQKYRDVLRLDTNIVKIPALKGKVDYALVGKSSFIYLVRDTDNDFAVLNAIIKDAIPLAYNIKVGMSKKEFFDILFKQSRPELLKKIDVVINGDPPGEDLLTYFIFKNQILDKVVMRVPL
ncbi:MAG TPA: hypothetical protein VHB54_07450 [Mucilaginibacter sp.]|nr:hypothetical protein [Mucilaginibacter sp.]HVW99550.1 hypothetical protein [Candidatus Babeliaceae bacterium]